MTALVVAPEQRQVIPALSLLTGGQGMTVLVLDPKLVERLKEEREASGGDRYDEVWDGVYIMPPLPNNEHQSLASRLGGVLQWVVEWPGLGSVFVGVNVSDREEQWEHNYRAPDVAVFLHGGRARNLGTHWCGGPDFIIEITSPNDQTRDKLPFYGEIGVRELLLIDRDPWALELYQLQGNQLVQVARATPDAPAVLTSAVLPLTFSLQPGMGRPHIEVVHGTGGQRWLV
jgi:Uma2 family endonuclease